MGFTFHLVIPDPSGARVLLVEDAHGWALPRVSTGEDFGERFVVAGVPEEIRQRFGLDIALLRTGLVVHEPADAAPLVPDGSFHGLTPSGDAFFFAENLTGNPRFAGEWCSEEALGAPAMSDERDRDVIQTWFTERREGAPARLQAWQREGWFDQASSWIRANLPNVTRVEQYITWSSSCLLRIEADARDYFFKATPDFFGHGVGVTARLAERFPEVVPRPVAIDEDRGWMVLEDFGDSFVGGMGIDHWERVLDVLVSMQRGSIPSVDALLREGCVDRRPSVLQEQIEDLAAGTLGALPDQLNERLRVAAPRLHALCAELAASPIPNTLVHGDLHADNVVFRDGRYLIFDWDDPSIAHPFVDLAPFLYVSDLPSSDPAAHTRLRDRFLAGWSDVMPHRDAVQLFERTEPVVALHHALSYLAIVEALDPSQQGEWASHVPWWFERALALPSPPVP